ncbi:hypothetical protein IQ07DRAFT_593492 [Pyrenochaeta sp. DS3sAY3a]|nr:hypothetical protein IQ07DRAFT_593492 [Pyrenochaeta sp. DS3sAY3a]
MSDCEAIMQFVYPKEAVESFDIDYLITTHMPLVEKHFKPIGLKSWFISQPTEDPGFIPRETKDHGYFCQCILIWESEKKMREAFASPRAMGPVMDDVKNFTDGKGRSDLWFGLITAKK